MFLFDGWRIPNQVQFDDVLSVGDSLLLRILERLVLLAQLRVLEHVLNIFTPFPRVDGQLGQHDLPQERLLIILEGEAHDLEVEAGKNAPRCRIDHLLRDLSQRLVAFYNYL